MSSTPFDDRTDPRPLSRALPLVATAFVMLIGGMGGWLLHSMLPVPVPAGSAANAALAEGPVVVKVGDEVLTLAQFNLRWSEILGEDARRFHASRGGRASYLDEAADELLLAREARRRGYHDKAVVQEAERSAANRLVARPLLADEVRAKAIPEEELRKYFAARVGEWRLPLRMRLHEIAVTSREGSMGLPEAGDAKTPEEARRKIDALHARAMEGEDMATLARQGSEAASASSGGDIGWLEPASMPAGYAEAATGLAAGALSAVFETETGFAFLRADEREEAREPGFDEKRGEILESLLAEDPQALARRYRIFVDELKKADAVELHPELLGEGNPPEGRTSALTHSGSPAR